ncbi:hypothetical protein ETU09_02800 [Apibacter muscae]|uniref:DUF4280 domain-containing protein n=1 Tax=Apibacter muscae TaxID=2509004 RepID=A0A563DIG1_9FLAO|nr:hypothetical protein [Apibacter muscae]TWP29927.1 hypothetical protein ETU09_02800 [Apibacter muscae]
MGNKIITEKDFWVCTEGNVPAQLQGTRLGTKKKSGDVYITMEDTSTCSFIDFGCKKYMLLMAIVAAVAVVALAVVGVLTVATGGAALIALGAIAGAVGAAVGGVIGGLLCGQKMGGARVWSNEKKNFISQGVPTITGGSTMTCKAGGIISFAPQIKSWSQAISLGVANYVGGIFEGMLAGAVIGMTGGALSGGWTAFAGTGIRGVGQAALNFAKSMPKNFYVNALESVSKVGLTLRGAMGAQGVAQQYGETGELGWETAKAGGKGVFGMEIGLYDSVGNIYSGKATWQDIGGIALAFAPVGKGKRELEENLKNKEAETKNKEKSKNEEENIKKGTVQEGETINNDSFDSFEVGDTSPQKVRDVESSIRNEPVEYGQFFDMDGNPLSDLIKGESGKITGLDKYFGQVDDGIFTHNHPKNGFFSEADLNYAKDANLGEIRAVTSNGTYSAKKPPNGWPNNPEKSYINTRNMMRENSKAIDYYKKGDLDNFQKLHDEILINNLKEEGYIFNKFNNEK